MKTKSFILSIIFTLFFAATVFAYNIVSFGPGYYPQPDKGKPISSGSIYVGEPDLDPTILANQKQLSVRQENGTVVAVSQPITTSAGGVPQYNGATVTLLVEGNYSLKVLDSGGSQVYYMPSNVEFSGVEVSLDLDYGCDLPTALAAIGTVDQTELKVDCDCIIADSTTVTSTDNISLNVINGGSFDGVAGGGTETLIINGPLSSSGVSFGPNLTVIFGDSTVTFNIPTDFQTIQNALDYIDLVGINSSIINLETGFKIIQGILIEDKDYRNVSIESVDAIVLLDASFVGAPVTTNSFWGDQNNGLPLFIAGHSYAPQWNIKVDMATLYGSGYCLSHSQGHVGIGMGVINAGYRGAQIIQESEVHAESSIWDGAADEGMRVQVNSRAALTGSSFDNCQTDPGLNSALYVSKGCFVDARDISATGSGNNGIEIRRSFAILDGADCSNAVGRGLQTESQAIVNFSGGVCDSSGGVGVYAQAGAIVNVGGATITNSGLNDMVVLTGGNITANSTTETTNSAAGGPAVEADCSVQSFNVMTGDGQILSPDAEPSIRTYDSGTWIVTKYGNGVMTMSGDFSLARGSDEQLLNSAIALPEPFSASDYTVSITPSNEAADWTDATDRDKVSSFGYSARGVNAITIILRVVSGMAFSATATADEVGVLLTGKWK